MLKIKITLNGKEHEITPADARKLLAELQEAFGEPERVEISGPNTPLTSPWFQVGTRLTTTPPPAEPYTIKITNGLPSLSSTSGYIAHESDNFTRLHTLGSVEAGAC